MVGPEGNLKDPLICSEPVNLCGSLTLLPKAEEPETDKLPDIKGSNIFI